MKTKIKVPPREGIPGLLELVHAGAAGDQKPWSCAFGVEHAFDPGLPLLHFVELVKDHEFTFAIPLSLEKCLSINDRVVIEILRLFKQRTRQSGFTALSWT